MIELEIQALSQTREGLLIDVGRSVVASGFTLQRQRLAQDPNGVLLTMVVRGPERKQNALEAALDANERVISFNTMPFEDGPPRPHFAATRKFAHQPPPPAPPAPVAEVTAAASVAAVPVKPVVRPPVVAPAIAIAMASTPSFDTVTPYARVAAVAPAAQVAVNEPEPELVIVQAPVQPEPAPEPEPEPEFVFMTPRAPAPKPAPVVQPFVEVAELDPDLDAIDKVLPKLLNGYPQIYACLQSLESAVAAGARESSLTLAGQRTGAWVLQRDYMPGEKLPLSEALERIGVPALSALVEVENIGGQLHIRNSPLCAEGGHSGCKFFSGYLEGLLGPIVGENLSIFALGCRSCGADACILAVSD